MLSQGVLLQGHYRILHSIGSGGMGAVYLAVDTHLPGRRCAVKEMSWDQVEPQDRIQATNAFQQEARILASLQHPGIATITDFFNERGNWYLVMEYVEGQSLDKVLAAAPGQRLPASQALDIFEQLCKVLEYLHAQTPPVIFRDLKPGNVMLTPANEVKLIDFGIARFFKPIQGRDTVNLGTPGYAAPEQYGGKGQSDARADVYGLGVLLHQMLTGYDPASTPFHLPPAESLNPTVPLAAGQAIRQATTADTNQRFPSVDAFRAAVTKQLVEPQSPSAPRWLMGVVGAGGMLLLIACAIAAYLLLRPESSPTPAATAVRSTRAPTTALTPTPPEPITRVVDVTATTKPGAGPGTEPETVIVVVTATESPQTPTPTQTTMPTPTQTAMPTPTQVATPTPTNSGGLVAYTAGPVGAWQIFIADPTSAAVWLLPGQPPNSIVPAWLPGGQRLAFRSNTSGVWQIYVINLDGSGLQQLTYGEHDNLEAVWSPDGTQVAFVSKRDGNKEIYVMDSAGGNQRRLTFNSGWDDDPNWSPDGLWLVFESQRDGRMDVYKMRSDGSNLVRLTSGGDSNYTPAWSPDGSLIAFEYETGSTQHIWIMNADGSNQRQITSDETQHFRPAWSPDGSEIAYTSDRDGVESVWIIPLDNSQPPRRLSPGEGFDAAWSRPW